MAQLGISTTAGHDIYHNESFPHVFGRHFGAVLRTAGEPPGASLRAVKVVTHRRAQAST